jgi:hypothetical protein
MPSNAAMMCGACRGASLAIAAEQTPPPASLTGPTQIQSDVSHDSPPSFFTRDELNQFAFTRDDMRECDKIGWGGAQPKPEWQPSGRMITSPIDLWEVEEARDDVGRDTMGEPVPVHTFLWSVLPPTKPYLTKLGGVPWRPADRAWPRDPRGKPYTFVAQFCFADSRHLVSSKLPGDVLLVFFEEWNSWTGENVVLEWSDLAIDNPLEAIDVPAQELPVPNYTGVIYATDEYPDGRERVYEALEGRNAVWMVADTQSTKIGRSTYFVQNDPRRPGEELLCTLSSVSPAPTGLDKTRASARWPLLDLERYATPTEPPDIDYWSTEMMVFADEGAQYFLIDREGRVRVTGDCG